MVRPASSGDGDGGGGTDDGGSAGDGGGGGGDSADDGGGESAGGGGWKWRQAGWLGMRHREWRNRELAFGREAAQPAPLVKQKQPGWPAQKHAAGAIANAFW